MAERQGAGDVAMPADRFLHARLGHAAKVSSLSDLEYRVWTTYVLAADDFGVLRADAVAFQAAHDALRERPVRAITGCIERLVTVGLVAAFEHQGAGYLYQTDWQDFQRVRYPLRTMHPLPIAAPVRARPAESDAGVALAEPFAEKRQGRGRVDAGAEPLLVRADHRGRPVDVRIDHRSARGGRHRPDAGWLHVHRDLLQQHHSAARSGPSAGPGVSELHRHA